MGESTHEAALSVLELAKASVVVCTCTATWHDTRNLRVLARDEQTGDGIRRMHKGQRGGRRQVESNGGTVEHQRIAVRIAGAP